MNKTRRPTPAYRWAVASRVLAATLGGYALSAAATALLTLLWPAPLPQAVMWATLLSFSIYTVVVIWVFCTASAMRAWVGVGLGTAVLAALAWGVRAAGSA